MHGMLVFLALLGGPLPQPSTKFLVQGHTITLSEREIRFIAELGDTDRQHLFAPMNNVNSFEPLVFLTRLDSMMYHKSK